MGRRIPTFSMAIEHEKRRWKPFRNALDDKSDRKDFDKMFDIPRLYTSACSNSAQINRLHPILMSILLHHFKLLTECIEQVKQIEAKVEEEIGLLPLLQQQQQQQQNILIDDILTKHTKLSQEQSVAVISEAKYSRVIAGAGAGKTEVLTRRVVYLLLVKKIPPSSIVAFTSTEKAAFNMKNRIYERVQQLGGGGEKATANLGEMYIGTIHGYAKRLLEDKFGMGDYDVFDENQEIAYVIRHARSLDLCKYERRSDICSEFIRSVNMVWEEMISDEDLEDRAPDFYRRMKNYEARLQNDRRLTFGKMIHSLVIKLREKPEAVENVRCLLVDEYQDINGAQAELIRIIGKKADVSLFVVGDPRQSIFQWRGSDERFFHTFAETFPNSELFSINENRRSVQQIVKLANHVADTFEEDTTTFVSRRKYEHLKAIRSEEEDDDDDDGFTVITQHRDKDSEAQWVVQQIELLLESNKEMKYSDFAIVLRSTNTSAMPFQLALKAHNIPFIVGGKVGLFKRDETQALGRIFAWLSEGCFWFNYNSWDRRGDKIQGNDVLRTGLECWIRVTNMQHTVQKGVVVVVDVDDMDADVEVKLNALKKELLLQSPKPRFKNLTEVFYNILNILGYQELDPSKPLDEVIMANLGRFHNLLTDYEAANRLGGRSIKWSEDLNGLCLFMNTYAMEAYGEQQSPPSDDISTIDAIQIMSIHQAKGLEWPVVFVPALVRQRFPSSRVGEQKFWCNIPRDMFDADRYEGTVEDERRLFYVAITRAKDVLVLSFFGDIANSSPFLRNLDGEQILLSLLSSPIANGEDLPRNVIVKPSSSSSSSSDSGAEMHSISAEEIITYEKCPQLYRFTKIWSYRPALRKEMGYGNSLHFCLRKASELIKSTADYGGRLMTPIDAIRISIDKNFHMPFVGGAVFDNFKRSASKVLTGFATKFGDDLLRVQEVEYRVEFPVRNYYSSAKATIMGRVDVIMKNNDVVEVRDYKTSEDARSFENAGEQIKIYTLGLKRMGWPVTVGSIAYLEGPEIRSVDVSEKAVQESQNKAISLIEEILHGNFKAKPSMFCGQCDYAEICKWKKNDSYEVNK
jgi:DNA helicase II / ATP-dependent DNA helicase PcrA